ncbi:MAG TPA: AAA family ATPase [Thermoanaerobaculia bacterium]|nr:AAA family ATPase [Thermoanaerobaculia bacterium]
MSLFAGRARRPVETVTPSRTFADVVLPPETRRTLDEALAQVRNHNLIFGYWGLGERHGTGLGLAFNFAGPPGTGKTICAEAIAHALGMKLLVVDYAEVESMWMGETPKNVAALFRTAVEQQAVLFFDEADAIATRRSMTAGLPQDRESNLTVNVLLRELDAFNGVVIFATNLAAHFDPAFERRIRTHVRFVMPGPEERERIWQVQIHPRKTPLGRDVDFKALAQKYEAAGGDIKNAVLKAASSAAAEKGSDAGKAIYQRHFERAMEDVLAAKQVMQQSLFEDRRPLPAEAAPWRTLALAALGVAVLAMIVAVVAIVMVL